MRPLTHTRAFSPSQWHGRVVWYAQTEKKKKKPGKGDFIISGPTAPAQHVVHVDKNWNWSSGLNGEEGHTQFDAGVKLGQGYSHTF